MSPALQRAIQRARVRLGHARDPIDVDRTVHNLTGYAEGLRAAGVITREEFATFGQELADAANVRLRQTREYMTPCPLGRTAPGVAA